MFAIELGAPWLIFAPRRIRFFGGAAIASLQTLILLTGNYTFFNFLTIALCLLLLDDFVLQKILPKKCPAFSQSNLQLSTSATRIGRVQSRFRSQLLFFPFPFSKWFQCLVCAQ